jgi:hypothetical protein
LGATRLMKVATRLYSRAFLCALLTLPAMSWAASASADVVTVTAKGTIAPTCSMTASQLFPAKNLNVAGSATATASVTCNQVFRMNATSTNGAIRNSAAAAAPYTNTLPYSLKADIGLDDGSTSTATCASSTLAAGQSACALSPANSSGLTSNGQIATNKTTTLTLSWTPPASPTFLKPGSYSDSITLTIAVVP